MACSLWSVDWLMQLASEDDLSVVRAPLRGPEGVPVTILKKKGW